MESLTYFKNVKIAPKKLRMIRDNIADMSPEDSLMYLQYMTLKSAQLFYAAIHSAIANATNTLKVSSNMLKFKLLTVEEGRKLKRYRAGSRGMAKPINKKFSHIKIILEAKKDVLPSKKPVRKKTETKKTSKAVIKPKTGVTSPKKKKITKHST